MGMFHQFCRLISPRVPQPPIFGVAQKIPSLSRAAHLAVAASEGIRFAFGDLHPPTADIVDIRLGIAERLLLESLEIVQKARLRLRDQNNG